MRLIDANVLHRKLFEIGCHKSKLHPMDVMKMIEEAPIAYDVDKVVEELEKLSSNIPLQYENNYEQGISDGIDKAIEIVKQGGVADDVCEWKKYRIIDDVQMYQSSCYHEFEERCVRKYKFCPYCGKKIKVV